MVKFFSSSPRNRFNYLANHGDMCILHATGGRKHMTSRLKVAGVVLVLAVLTRPSDAAQINYGSHMGTNFTYVNVTEDTGASEPLPLFGAPTVTGNSMDFNPVGFDAASTGAG